MTSYSITMRTFYATMKEALITKGSQDIFMLFSLNDTNIVSTIVSIISSWALFRFKYRPFPSSFLKNHE